MYVHLVLRFFSYLYFCYARTYSRHQRQHTAYNQRRARAATSRPPCYTRLLPASRAGGNITRVGQFVRDVFAVASYHYAPGSCFFIGPCDLKTWRSLLFRDRCMLPPVLLQIAAAAAAARFSRATKCDPGSLPLSSVPPFQSLLR